MKFGNNLQHLSIPEWRCYNIDYNDLKYQIRTITQSKSSNLKPLHQSFVDNFDYVNLFVQTKYGELLRKFNYFEVYFDQLVNSSIDVGNKNKLRSILIEIDEIFYQIIEISQILKNLSKFILIQKIAVKKIFKKFLKYYKDESSHTSASTTTSTTNNQKSLKFIINLKNYLLLNKNSFVNFNSNDLTIKLTNIISSIKVEQKRYYNLINNISSINPAFSNHLGRKNSFYSTTSLSENSQYQHSILPRTESYFTLQSAKLSSSGGDGSNSSPPSNPQTPTGLALSTTSSAHPHYHIQQDPPTNEANFDLAICVKKNFDLNCLIPDDPNTLNEILLNLNIYLNFKNYDNNAPPTTFLSFIYLTNDQDQNPDNEPSYIISQKDETFSIIVGYIGGLRKYSYCILPNDIVQLFIEHLNNRDNQDIKHKLYDYFKSNKVSTLTRKAFDAILTNNLKPTLRLILQRRRYLLKQTEEEEDKEEENQLNVDDQQLQLQQQQQHRQSQSEDDNKAKVSHKYQDDYLITLDTDIFTTNNSAYVSQISFPPNSNESESQEIENTWDKFPHSNLSFYSNDSNLNNFENSLSSEINVKDGLLINHYSSSLLRRLPVKLQNLINNNNSLNLFKGLDFYSYMNSCYNNIVPEGKYLNNHYNFLLNLNLLKNFENIENFNNQLNSENMIIKEKSNKILKHQLSLKSLSKFNQENYHTSTRAPDFYLKANQQHFQQLQQDHQQQSGDSLGTNNSSSKSVFTKSNAIEDEEEDDDEDDGVLNMNLSQHDLLQFRRQSDEEELQQEQLIDNLDENEYSIYLKLNNEDLNHNSTLETFMNRFLKFKKHAYSQVKSIFFMEPFKHHHKHNSSSLLPQYKKDKYNLIHQYEGSSLLRPVSSPEVDYSNPYAYSNSGSAIYNYDSINEEPPTFLNRNKFMNIQYHYELDYDQTLSYIYFSLNLMSIFLSGIELGIIYSIFIINHSHDPSTSPNPPPQFLIMNNLWLILILIMGLLLSLIFSMISINLIFQRYHQAPLYHTFIAWIGFTIVCVCCIWSFVLLMQGF